MNAIARTDNADIMEQVIIKGDLSKLTPQERTSYYMKVCESIGLNPLTKPFEYILLNNKLQLYALKACTEQLRGIHGVSVTDLTESMHEGVFIVTAKVVNKEGRTDAAKGAVPIAGLKGESLANAMMKAETKAKRRATLSLCGLGWLDESEVESIAGAQVVPGGGAAPMETVTAAPKVEAPKAEEPKATEPAPATKDERAWARTVFEQVQGLIKGSATAADINDALKANKAGLKDLERISPPNFEKLKTYAVTRREELKGELNDPLPDLPDDPRG